MQLSKLLGGALDLQGREGGCVRWRLTSSPHRYTQVLTHLSPSPRPCIPAGLYFLSLSDPSSPSTPGLWSQSPLQTLRPLLRALPPTPALCPQSFLVLSNHDNCLLLRVVTRVASGARMPEGNLSCVTTGEFLNLSVPGFPHPQIKVTKHIPTSWLTGSEANRTTRPSGGWSLVLCEHMVTGRCHSLHCHCWQEQSVSTDGEDQSRDSVARGGKQNLPTWDKPATTGGWQRGKAAWRSRRPVTVGTPGLRSHLLPTVSTSKGAVTPTLQGDLRGLHGM